MTGQVQDYKYHSRECLKISELTAVHFLDLKSMGFTVCFQIQRTQGSKTGCTEQVAAAGRGGKRGLAAKGRVRGRGGRAAVFGFGGGDSSSDDEAAAAAAGKMPGKKKPSWRPGAD